MTSLVIEPQDPEDKDISSSSFNPLSPIALPSSKSESENTTDLQSRLDSAKEFSVLSASAMNFNERFHLPELTRSNFLDWEGKVVSVLRSKDLYGLVLDKEEKRRDEKGHLTGRLSQNGGKTCPIALWANIQAFGASKKKANAFKAWYKLNGLDLRIDNIPQYTTEYWNCIATLQSLGEVIEPVSLGHAILAKMPVSLSHVRDALIAAGSSSDLEVSYETVLDLLDSQLSASVSTTKAITAPSVPRPSEPGEASALLTQKCPQGRHIPSSTHTAENCFSLHPEKLVEFRKAMSAKQEAEAHLAMFVPPTMFNVEATAPEESSINDLIRSFKALPTDSKEEDDDGHESEVSLI
ncbi:hypothetical protein Pst134EA_011723 [Puccinia striiformis f. sp. tritici]|uniref:Uncharacterized protein n=1 Tax=Puccinia striiformis f. sp. tritici PST-78 TaxID=1165861 RepID=A0A0L0VUW8_9BASI|nr:hypothetical protein Pst134EA_011723 [Puccinia striiformis f. sp. tritici]KAH9468102.1 hypothetical protein Pst134EA_011723 [Puccinia striiformis f. sp. tritici]KAI9605301.1 hypothetical protein H4Q26_003283 [Puccinia striiformis f. sp. tritici PST-130]KNF03094.1 hypothetical protein PSTG_03679 [Puccinia striiformis f. sp. tritici PST-78]